MTTEILLPKFVMVDPKLLKHHPKNVKHHDATQLHDLGILYEWIGFTDPIIADKDNIVWAGNGSLDAALAKEMPLVPVIYMPEDWTDLKKQQFMLMDNRITESKWNHENFKPLFDKISPQMGEIFQSDFTSIIEQSTKPEDMSVAKPEKDLPPLPDEPKSKPGQIYQLGNHRIMCGDSSKDLDKLLENKTVDLLITDPPYGVDYSSKNKFLNKMDKGNRIQKDIKNDNIKDYREFFGNFLKNIPFSEYNSFYINMSGLKLLELSLALEENDYKISQHLVWVKNNHVLGRQDYSNKHEFIVYGWKGKHEFYGDFQTTVWSVNKPAKSPFHPTMKPVELALRSLRNSSKVNDIVLDCFLGSGSTVVACEQTNRICYGMEIDPGYIDVIIKRWENYTGKQAKLIK